MEKLYHYLWKTRLRGSNFRDVDGHEIEVVHPGLHNHDSGPDFFNSKIKIDGTEWVGNVEIHVKASDWWRHGHDKDPAYDNVVLHVVAVSDRRVFLKEGRMLPQMVLTFPEEFYTTYLELCKQGEGVRCGAKLNVLEPLQKTDWLETLSIERLQQKARRVLEIRNLTGGDWEQTCFIMLARGLGFGLNGDPFELLGKSIPLKYLHHHSDNLFQLEALLFGQAAMLDSTLHIFDDYYQGLCREYYFLARKYGLKPMRPGQWKYARTRPHNFPHRRVALLANSSLNGFSLFTRLREAANDLEKILKVFDMSVSGYWESHYSFDVEMGNAPRELSRGSRLLLAINVALPLLYAYNATVGDYEAGERVASLMLEIPPENNRIINQWKSLGFEAKDAAGSQALIHLKNEYCDKGKCLDCRFGHLLLRKSVATTG